MANVSKIKLPDNTIVNIKDARNVVIGDGLNNVVKLTKAQYDALATKDPNTVYIITDVDGSGSGGSGGGSVTVDSELSSTSENPVQNKAIYAAIGNIETLLAAL